MASLLPRFKPQQHKPTLPKEHDFASAHLLHPDNYDSHDFDDSNLWEVKVHAVPPVIGWYRADTGEPYPYYYTRNEIGADAAKPPADPLGSVDERWDDDDGTEVHLTM